MRAHLDKEPNCTRMAFFLGTTLHSLGRLEEALEAFQYRIDLGSWYLERFECHLRRVRIPSSPPLFSSYFFLALLSSLREQRMQPSPMLLHVWTLCTSE